MSCTPPEIRKIAENTTVHLLPVKSHNKYESNKYLKLKMTFDIQFNVLPTEKKIVDFGLFMVH
jgi:hypothetical protein